MPPVKGERCCQHVCGFRYADDMYPLSSIESIRVLVVEDEPYMAEAIRDGLRLEAIAADIAELQQHVEVFGDLGDGPWGTWRAVAGRDVQQYPASVDASRRQGLRSGGRSGS